VRPSQLRDDAETSAASLLLVAAFPPLVNVTVALPPIKARRSTFAPYGPRQFGP